jgi:hypothetical protein
MTEWYCHFDPNEFAQARKVQEALLLPENQKPVETVAVAPDKAGTAGVKEAAAAGKARRGSVLPFPAQEGNKKRKRA